jgi:PleD family two-component response regulator
MEVETENGTIRITISAGVAELQSGDDTKHLLARADAALYDAKHSGRNRVGLAPASRSPSPGTRVGMGT